MPTELTTNDNFGIDIIDALNLGKMVTKLEIIIDAEAVPLVRVESFIETDVKGELIKHMEEYRLVRREIAE